MPIYEYKCDKCGEVFDVKQKFADEPLTQHEGCGGAVERLLSAPALQFKGSGWYITDYARKSSNGSSKGSSKTSDTTKSDTSSSSSSTTTTTPTKKD